MTVRLTRHALARMGQKAGFETLAARAEALGISRSHMNKVERGELKPGAELVDRMSAAYHVHLDVIYRASRLAVRTLRQLQLDQADEIA